MRTRFPNRRPIAHRPPRRDVATHGNPLYGHGYNPSWPSILSVAHDESNGGRLFVITDRPCLLGGSVLQLPLAVAGLSVLEAVQELPVRFRLWMSGPVPHGAAWTWGPDGTGIFDPVTNRPPNAASGDCADFPGAFTPVAPAVVVAATPFGSAAALTFDKAIVLASGGAIDGAITFNGSVPDSFAQTGATSINFNLPTSVNAGDPWAISAQPGWAATPVAWPAAGVL